MPINSLPPFLVLALPRSRTAWLSQFLSCHPWVCGHDQIRYFRTLDDARSWFMQPYIGSAETVGPAYWRLVQRYAPDCRVVVVRRPVLEVLESIRKKDILGMDYAKLLQQLRYLNGKLDQIEARLPNTLSVNFDELADFDTCDMVFQHCLGAPLHPQWFGHWNGINVQVNLDAIMRYMFTHGAQMAKLANSAKHQMLVDLTSQKPAVSNSGLEIAEEPFNVSMRDAQELMSSHCLAIGQNANDWADNNIPLMQAMDDNGSLQVLTARANGRLFGYLVSILGPSTESTTGRSATHVQFFASKEWPGAGLRLQREALYRLRAKGFNEVVMRSWLGPGAKIETLYKRLGAELDGQLYRIRLEQ